MTASGKSTDYFGTFLSTIQGLLDKKEQPAKFVVDPDDVQRAKLIAIREAVLLTRAEKDARVLTQIAILLGADPEELKTALGQRLP